MKITEEIKFLCLTKFTSETIQANVGNPDYSYYFVAREFQNALKKYCSINKTNAPPLITDMTPNDNTPIDQIIVLAFYPPHKLRFVDYSNIISVFAWEFDTLPSEDWDKNTNQNWVSALRRCAGAIVHSNHTLSVLKSFLGDSYPAVAIPSPVWDKFEHLAHSTWQGSTITLDLYGIILDSKNLIFSGDEATYPYSQHKMTQQLNLSGIVFTSVFNPDDDRKNWYDQLTAFVWAFRDNPEVTLVLKVISHEMLRTSHMILLEMRKLAPYLCRIISIHAHLDTANYSKLMISTTFIVNASVGEGQCLPLMEFMSAGRPAIAPFHTALTDYINENNAFIIESDPEWTHWPHDPRRLYKCMRHRINWESLRDAYINAYKLVRTNPALYSAMCLSATNTLKNHCSFQKFREKFDELSIIMGQK